MHCAGSSGRRAGSRTSSEGDPAPSGSHGAGREAPGVPEPAAYGELVPPLRWLETPGIISPGARTQPSARHLPSGRLLCTWVMPGNQRSAG